MLWSIPHLQGFNFIGGVAVTPELFALTVGLSIYSAAYIAEIVRSGVQAIPRGQIEAARSLGLSPWQIARLIEVPLALRIIVPPLGAYYVILLKNTSLGSAIAYPDLMHVFAGTVLNQTGQPVGSHADHARDLSGPGARRCREHDQRGEPMAVADKQVLALHSGKPRALAAAGISCAFVGSCISSPLNAALTAAIARRCRVSRCWSSFIGR